MAEKRAASPEGDDGALVVAKRQRTDEEQQIVTKDGIRRTSCLLAPTMRLVGHQGEVNGVEFSPDGESLASCSFDKSIMLWRIRGECPNYAMVTGHKSAVLEVHWLPSGDQLASCSADRTVRAWDALSGKQVRACGREEGRGGGRSGAPCGARAPMLPPLAAPA